MCALRFVRGKFRARWRWSKKSEARGYPEKYGDALTEKLFHIVTTSRFEGIFEVIRHGMSRAEAAEYITLLSRYHRSGFFAVFESGKA